MVEIQLRKWTKRAELHNVTLNPKYSNDLLPQGEIPVAEVIDRSGCSLFFSRTGFTLPGRGFIRYDDVKAAAWISFKPDRFKHKQQDHDHIELRLRDGLQITLADLDQAAFPLLKFFEWMVGRNV